MVTCLLRNLDDIDKADMQSATVILGLMPTVISYVGPTVADTTLVSSHRPVLAILTALGAPAIFPTRLFKVDSLEKRINKGTWRLDIHNPIGDVAVIVIEYLLLVGTIANSLHNSWQLGHRTVLSWKCLWSFMEFLWNFIPLFLISAPFLDSGVLRSVITRFCIEIQVVKENCLSLSLECIDRKKCSC